jgi:hypothetical protein
MPEPAAIGPEAEEGVWTVRDGLPSEQSAQQVYRADGVEYLTYSNPFGQNLERVWFDDQIVFALELGEVEVDPERVKVAQEYQIVYSVDLDRHGKLDGQPERVDGQYNIYDSVPGMEKYSPLWQFNYVVVPRDYVPNSLRSEKACLASGYPIKKSKVVEN